MPEHRSLDRSASKGRSGVKRIQYRARELYRHWPQALGQQVYAFALGVFYAYWLEKSRSIRAPIIGHNAGDVVEYLIVFAWCGAL